MAVKKPELISVSINVDWFRRICNVHPTWPIEDVIAYVNRVMRGGGRTQILIMLGEECLKQMEEGK